MERKRERILFVTGKLAARALDSTVRRLAEILPIDPQIHVAKISVAALMTTRWLAGKLSPPAETDRVLIPGGCAGDLEILRNAWPGIVVERGPVDLRDLPGYFKQQEMKADGYGAYDIEILAEINHANRLARGDLVSEARRLRSAGADIIDLGTSPGEPWTDVADAVGALVDLGIPVSIDSFEPAEVSSAIAAGAKLVLSVNSSNIDHAVDWGAEVIVIPDDPHGPGWLDELARIGDRLRAAGIRHRFDPILDPIGFGFADSLGRYLSLRRSMPDAEILCGVGNLTEMTEADSAGINAILIGFCQEVGIRSVLTTEVITWARSATAEIDVARRLMHDAVVHHRPPKHTDGRLVMLRGPGVRPRGEAELRRLHAEIKDPNFRIFAEGGSIVVMNHERFEESSDPFELFDRLGIEDPSHAFYLGWEMMKAALAIELGKDYTQDQSLPWGLLTTEEKRHRGHASRRSVDECE